MEGAAIEGQQDPESSYRLVYAKYWQDIKSRDPAEITAVRSVSYDMDSQQFGVKFFNEDYIVDSSCEKISRQADGQAPEAMAMIIILNYLASAHPLITPESKTEPDSPAGWLSVKEIPGGMIFYAAFYKSAISVLIQAFETQAARLGKAGQALGGGEGPFRNSAVFKAFPEVSLCAVVWEGDEEVPANATILYAPSIEQILDNAICIDLGVYLAGRLKSLAAND